MRAQRTLSIVLASLLAGGATYAQVNRGWSEWPTAQADAQRTSWTRTDPKISVAAMSAPGFELQWSSKVDNQNRGLAGLTQGITVGGVTLFVPMSIVAGSSNNVFALDNDTGYVVWQRKFDAALPSATDGCAGGITAAPTRIVNVAPVPTPVPGAAPAPAAGRGAVGYRSMLGEPGAGAPVEGRAGGAGRAAGPAAGRAGGPAPAAPGRAGGAPAGAPAAGPVGEAGFARQGGAGAGQGRGQAAPGIPGAPAGVGGGGGLGRPSGVVYVVSSDGMLHVLGLQSGKDLQQPARFVPANAQWSNAVAVGTTLYAATTGNCGGAPAGVWAIDLDSAAKPVVSYRTNGGNVVGPVALSTDGTTLFAALGAGATTGDGKSNAIVALDAKTLQLKDWFTQPTSEFATGPMVFRHGTRDIVTAATKDGRVLLLDGASLGGSTHATPLAASRAIVARGGTIGDALATWEHITAAAGSTPATTTRWILAPVSGRPAGGRAVNGAVRNGAVVNLRVREANGTLSLEPVWTSHDLSAPAAPIIVNGVVFALGTGRPAAAGGAGTPAMLHAYDGATGKALWNSGKAMTAFASPGSFWSALSQAYVGTNDGTIYAFGFLDERR
jgi:hypothetical protein